MSTNNLLSQIYIQHPILLCYGTFLNYLFGCVAVIRSIFGSWALLRLTSSRSALVSRGRQHPTRLSSLSFMSLLVICAPYLQGYGSRCLSMSLTFISSLIHEFTYLSVPGADMYCPSYHTTSGCTFWECSWGCCT